MQIDTFLSIHWLIHKCSWHHCWLSVATIQHGPFSMITILSSKSIAYSFWSDLFVISS
jgi:hypothetical protein